MSSPGRRRRHLLGRCVALAVLGLAAHGAAAPAAGAAESARAVERCEASVVDTLRQLHGRAEGVQFLPAQRAPALDDEADVAVKGSGRYRRGNGSSTFTYSCTYNLKTAAASGVVLREAAPGNAAAVPEAAWQPDLSRVSPEACESAVARLLKDKHPRVANIVIDPGTRRLEPGAEDARALRLVGLGAVQRAPGMNAVPFSYECDFDARRGQLVGVRTSV